MKEMTQFDYGKLPQNYNFDLVENDGDNDELCINENYELKAGLNESVDYIIVDKNIMDFFKNSFSGKDIMRKAYILPDGNKKIEIYQKKVNLYHFHDFHDKINKFNF